MKTKYNYFAKKTISCMMAAAVLLTSAATVELSSSRLSAEETESSLVYTSVESLSDRALVAVDASGATVTDMEGNEYNSGVYLSWRAFDEDLEAGATYSLYRNGSPIASGLTVTNLLDEAGSSTDEYLVVGSNDSNLGIRQVTTAVWDEQYVEVELCKPASQVMPDGSTAFYHANDMSVGDLNADGDYELIVKWYPSNAQDNANSGYTGTTIIDAYDINTSSGAASLLWRIDLGVNIRSGAHYTQFQVWDFNGDGKADIAMKTADGSTIYVSGDGTGSNLTETGHVGAVSASALPTNKISAQYDYRNSSGYILSGSEYFTIFDGSTGKIIDTASYVPARGTVSAWGDDYGNRVDRFLSAVAYLDGENPYAVFARGYYTRTALTAYYLKDTDSDGLGDTIDIYWSFDSDTYDYTNTGATYGTVTKDTATAQGNHAMSVNDVDGDGKDDIIYGAMVLNSNGTVRYTTGLGHGDAQHISDWVTWNDGLEIMSVHEHTTSAYGVEIRDANTGEILMGYKTGKDTGRGVAADIDPTMAGAEFWASNGPSGSGGGEWYSTDAGVFSTTSSLNNLVRLSTVSPAANFSIYWDGDPLSEILDHSFNSGLYLSTGVRITKWNWQESKSETLLYSSDVFSINGTKGNVGLASDILGDWRDEIIVRTTNGASERSGDNVIRIYTTTYMTDYVIPTLMQNHAYRLGVAWQNVGYNQPANLDYTLSDGVIASRLAVDSKSYDAIELAYTAASDGAVYGHEVEGYEIYRSTGGGAYELVYPAVEYAEGDTLYKFDVGTRSGTASGFTNISSVAYSAATGYGYTSAVGLNTGGVGVTVSNEDGTVTDLAALVTAISDIAYATGELTYAIDVSPGVYKVDVYASSGASNPTYNPNVIYINGVNMGTCVNGSATNPVTPSQVVKSLTVTVGAEGQIVVSALNPASRAFMNAIIITEMVPVEGSDDTNDSDFPRTFTDTNVAPRTTYSYMIAPVVNGRTGYMSQVLTVTTGFAVASVVTTEVTLVEDTPIPSGGTVADLLPTHLTVLNADGVAEEAEVFAWDVQDLDILTVDTYTVLADIVGFSELVEVSISVVARQPYTYGEVKRYAVTNEAITLSNPLDVVFTNTRTYSSAVTWDYSAVDFSANGEYLAEGYLVDYPDFKVCATIYVVDDYITGILTDDIYMEIQIGSSLEDAALPETVQVQNYKGTTANVPVVWDLSGVDTAVSGKKVYEISGAIDGFDGSAALYLYVDYEPVYKFDFGISTSKVASGWTGVTVNVKDGTQTYDALGLAYSADKGYGILGVSGSATAPQGRTEEYTLNGILPSNVYTDFALLAGENFAVDLPNGTYAVEGIVTSNSNVNTSTFSLEGGAASFSISNGAENNYGIGRTEVDVTDGQLNIVITGNVNRIGGIVIRQISVMEAGEIIGYDENVETEAVVGTDVGAVSLPSTITIYFDNATSLSAAVTWNTTGLDTSVTGDYTIYGTLDDYNGYAVSMTVKVKADYIASIVTGDIYAEAALGAEPVSSLFPETVTVAYSGGQTAEVAVTWDMAAWDTSAVGTVQIRGTVEGYDGYITLYLYVDYEPVYMFDFGLTSSPVEDGWTGVKVNVKNGTTTNTSLGIIYDAEKGYGFTNVSGTAAMAGRHETYTLNGRMPYNVYVDYALPASGDNFAVDVENGKYVVEVVATGTGGSDRLYYSVNDSANSVKNNKSAYDIGRNEIEVTNGRINVTMGTSGTNRLGAIIIRQVEGGGSTEPEVDKTALSALYSGNEGKAEADYTTASWAAFQLAMNNAKDVLDSGSAAQNDVDEACAALTAAVSGLVALGDMSGLNVLISQADAIDTEGYTADSVLVFAAALETAKAVAANSDSAQVAIDGAFAALSAAIDGLETTGGEEPQPVVDKIALAQAIELAEDMDISETDYTAESSAAFAEALADAKDVLNDGDADQDDVDSAISALLSAITGLEEIQEPVEPVDKSDLGALLNQARGLFTNAGAYTQDSWAEFYDAYKAALRVYLTGEDADEIAEAYKDLSYAIDDLEEKPAIGVITVGGGVYASDESMTVYTEQAEDVQVRYTFAATGLEYAGTMNVTIKYDNTVMAFDAVEGIGGLDVMSYESASGDITTMTAYIYPGAGETVSGDVGLFTVSFTIADDNAVPGNTVVAAIAVGGFTVAYYPDGDMSGGNIAMATTVISPNFASTSVSYYLNRFDVNNSGSVDMIDVEYVRSLLGSKNSDDSWEAKAAVCDFNGDGVIDILDFTIILAKHYAG